MANSYDAIVIGTGQAGPTLAADLAGAGKRVAIVERHRFGGTCVNVGCIPTKALVASARAAHVARRAAEYGVVIDGEVRVDMTRVKARKDAIVRQSNEGLERWLKGLDNCTVFEGHARFETPHQIRVGDQLLDADQIFVNVGARAYCRDSMMSLISRTRGSCVSTPCRTIWSSSAAGTSDSSSRRCIGDSAAA